MSDQAPYSSFPDHDQRPNQGRAHVFPSNGPSSSSQPYTEYPQQPGSYPAYLPFPLYASYPEQPVFPPSQPYTHYPQRECYPPPQLYVVPNNAHSQRRRMGPAIASLALGIIGVLSFAYFIGFFVSIAGLILAYIGMKRPEGKGMAVAGLVLSIVGIVFGACIVATGIFAHTITNSLFNYLQQQLFK